MLVLSAAVLSPRIGCTTDDIVPSTFFLVSFNNQWNVNPVHNYHSFHASLGLPWVLDHEGLLLWTRAQGWYCWLITLSHGLHYCMVMVLRPVVLVVDEWWCEMIVCLQSIFLHLWFCLRSDWWLCWRRPWSIRRTGVSTTTQRMTMASTPSVFSSIMSVTGQFVHNCNCNCQFT